MAVQIKRSDLERIVEHSRQTFPIEACGILLGVRNNGQTRVTAVYPTRNILESESSFQINPQDQLDVFTTADELSLDILGYYHSHPHWRAQPSETDRRQANQPGSDYIIYSNIDNEIRSFHWDGTEFRPEELTILDDGT